MNKVDEALSLYNDDGKTLQEISDIMGIPKSTIQKSFTKCGYKLDRKVGKYKKNVSSETISCDNNVSCNSNVSRETTVNRTYAISENIDRAIKIKSAIEGIKPIDIVRSALDSYIEDKYKNM